MNDDKREADNANFAQAVRHIRENLPAMMEFERLNAKLTRQKFMALIGEGFTDAQALELCKKP